MIHARMIWTHEHLVAIEKILIEISHQHPAPGPESLADRIGTALGACQGNAHIALKHLEPVRRHLAELLKEAA